MTARDGAAGRRRLRLGKALWPRPCQLTLYYLESHSAGCLVANRIVTRMPFAGFRGRIAPIWYRNRRGRFRICRVAPSRHARFVIGVIVRRLPVAMVWTARRKEREESVPRKNSTVTEGKKEERQRKAGRKARSERGNDRARIILPSVVLRYSPRKLIPRRQPRNTGHALRERRLRDSKHDF